MKINYKKAVSLPAVFAAIFPFMSIQQNADAASASKSQQKFIVYVGTYGKGVQAVRFDAGTMEMEPLGLVGEVPNPSWVTSDPEFKYLYAVSEVEGKVNGKVASFAIDRQTGKLRHLNSVGSGGEAPCYASVDATGKMLVVANYGTGEISAFPIKPDGSLEEKPILMTAKGSSVDKERQEGPHAHEAVIGDNNTRVYVPDLGLDRIRLYKLDAASSKLVENDPPFAKAETGHGPRHMAFGKGEKYAYVLNELKPVVSVYAHNSSTGNLTHIQSIATLPADFKEENSGAEIRVDQAGKFVYTTNRGNDSIQVFAIDASDGKLRHVQTISAGGKEPRGMALDPTGQYLFAGNQNSNTLVIFKVNAATGELSPTGKKLDIVSPVDVFFVPAA